MTGRDQAVRFAELLFEARPDGSLIVVSVAPDWTRPHCVVAPADVADYATGTGDVYVRHSPISRRPPQGRRGDERLTAALLGIVQDLDVNGSPDGRGGTVTGACPDHDAALELAHALLEPTITVNSGYGLQTFHLLDAPLLTAGDDELEAAKALTRGWAERMKRLAGELGMTKLDTVCDLARVVRVPGSFNTKGAEPVPVELLDDGGPRYPLERLRSLAATNGRPKPKPAKRVAGKTTAQAALERHPDLDRLARRKGKKPGDGSPSAWDFALGCRAAEDHALDDATLEALIRHARALHDDPKGERDDYVERTVANVRKRVGYPGSERDRILGELAELWQLAQVELTIADVLVSGDGMDAAANVELSDGTSLYFDKLEYAAKPERLAVQLSTAVGVWADFTSLQARRSGALIRRYVGRRRTVVQRDLLRGWLLDLLQAAEQIDFDDTGQAPRWTTWQQLNRTKPHLGWEDDDGKKRAVNDMSPETYASRVRVAHDTSSGLRYVRSGWLHEYLRRCGAREFSRDLANQVELAGWFQRGKEGRIKATDPDSDKTIVLRCWTVPNGWLEANEATGDEDAR